MAFRKNAKLSEEQYCEICQQKVHKGKIIDQYKQKLPFVCDSCYSVYFKDVEKLETSVVNDIRPAKIHSDRYMMKHLFARTLVWDMLLWPIIGLVLWAVCRLLTVPYPDGFLAPTPLFLRLVMLVYVFFTALGALNALRLLISGLLRGLDVQRRILLLIKIAEYALCVFLVIMFVIM